MNTKSDELDFRIEELRIILKAITLGIVAKHGTDPAAFSEIDELRKVLTKFGNDFAYGDKKN